MSTESPVLKRDSLDFQEQEMAPGTCCFKPAVNTVDLKYFTSHCLKQK